MKRNQWAMGLIIAVAMLPIPPASGQTPPPAPPPAATNAQDYSQGFSAFLRLGLPDTSKATYVNLQSDVLHQFGGYGIFDAGYNLHEVQLRGNAWLLAENTSATSTLLTASGVVLELVDEKTYRQRRATGTASNALARIGAVMPRRAEVPMGSWKPCDLGRDLGQASAFVAKKLEAKAADARELRYDSFLRSDEGPGTLFLLAVLAWQHGRQQEANALAGSLFALAGDSRKVILSAMNVLADAQLAVAGADFRFTRDWQAYQAAVAALLQKFPAGWRKAGAARMLQEHLQARAAMQAPPPVTGEGLDDEDRALAAALATEPESASGHGYAGDFWFLVASNRVARRLPEPEPADVMARIQSRGLRSVPLLLALAGDEVLCPRFRSESGMPTIHTFFENDSGPSDEARTQTYYRQMDRPLTRGEIARHLLAPLCPREESERRHGDDEQTPEEVVEAARETYLALKALPPTGQADYFLKHGDQNQKQAAVRFLLMENDFESHVPQIEAFLLTPPTEMSYMMHGGYGGGLVSEYVEKRGEAAADFVERYAAMRQKIDLPVGMASNEELVAQVRKMADREVANLRSMVRKPDLDATIAALVNAESGEDKGGMAAYQALGRLPAETAMPAMLNAAIQSTNAAVRSRLLSMMPMLRQSGMQEGMEELMEDADTPEAMEAVMQLLAARKQASIGTNGAAWRVLLADTRPAFSMGMGYGDTRKLTLADLAATAIEALYSDGSSMRSFGAGESAENLPAEVTMRVLRDRAAARLAGKPEAELPRLPSADDVPEERRAALVAAVTGAAPAELPKLLERFSPAETLYLGQAVDDHAALAKALAAPSRRIATVQVDNTLPPGVAARLKQLEGTAVTTNAIAVLHDCCRLLLTNGMACNMNLSSAGFGRGLSLVAQPVGNGGLSGMGHWVNRRTANPQGIITGMLQGGEEGYGHGLWMVELPPAAVPAVAAAAGATTVAGAKTGEDEEEDDDEEMAEMMMSGFEEQNQAFDEAARSFCSGDAPLAGNASITFTGMLPPKPGEKNVEDDDDVEMIIE